MGRTTITSPETEYFGASCVNTFLSIEPLLEPFSADDCAGFRRLGEPLWVIIGAMTGPGSKRKQPKREWVEAIVKKAREAGTADAMIDRLRLNPQRLDGMVGGLRDLARLPDPVGDVVRGWTNANGVQVRQVRVPFGVVGIIYEARPNVTADAAGIALKSGNAALLRGSSSAADEASVPVTTTTATTDEADTDGASVADETSEESLITSAADDATQEDQ